jgi:hypothetical protein
MHTAIRFALVTFVVAATTGCSAPFWDKGPQYPDPNAQKKMRESRREYEEAQNQKAAEKESEVIMRDFNTKINETAQESSR